MCTRRNLRGRREKRGARDEAALEGVDSGDDLVALDEALNALASSMREKYGWSN